MDSVSELGRRFPEAYWFVPSGCRGFILSTVKSVDKSRVREFLWWEEAAIGETGVKMVFTPAQHWSARNLIFDSFSVSDGGLGVFMKVWNL